MAPRSALALFLTLNVLFFTITAATRPGCPPPPRKHKHKPTPTPTTPTPTTPTPTTPTPTNPTPTTPTPTTPTTGTCPRDSLKLGICVNALNLVNVTLGTPPVQPCCSLIQGLADLEAAVCLCTAIRASILGININLPINLSLLLNVCSRNTPRGFQCP